jgi:hypothetical protein
LARSKKLRKLTYNTGLVPKIEALISSGSTMEFNSTAKKLKMKRFENIVDLLLGFMNLTIATISRERMTLVIADTTEATIWRALV